jgi:hypothetical protein
VLHLKIIHDFRTQNALEKDILDHNEKKLAFLVLRRER